MLRSTRSPIWLATGFLVLLPSAASAHGGADPAVGFLHGFTHPFLGWDHILAMLAVGLWAGQRGGARVWALPAAFVAAMAVGGALGMAGVSLPAVEAGILASLLVLGALIAMAVRWPLHASAAAVALFAIFHGHAHGAEMPTALGGFAYALGFTSATALLHGAGLLAVTLAGRAAGKRRVTWVRLAGVSISLVGVALAVL